MAYEKKAGDLAVFRNTRKEQGDNKPDYEIVGLGLNGEKIKGALWLKKDRNGNTFMAGSIQPDTYEGGRGGGGNEGFSGQAGRSTRGDPTFDDSDIPFVSRYSMW